MSGAEVMQIHVVEQQQRIGRNRKVSLLSKVEKHVIRETQEQFIVPMNMVAFVRGAGRILILKGEHSVQ